MIHLHSIEIAVPEGRFSQSAFGDWQRSVVRDPKLQRCLEGMYQDSGIEFRHSVVVESGEPLQSGFYGIPESAGMLNRTSAERNEMFAAGAPELAIRACAEAVHKSGFGLKEVTHLITVSCTGFYNPGPDLAIIESLGLSSCIQRYQIGFMGCNAALPALRMAEQFCRADPKAVVLIVCIELCSLHLHPDQDLDTILANSLFADGVAATVLSARAPVRSGTKTQVGTFASAILPEGAPDMAWRIGDHGFDIVLSRYVPRIIGANLEELVCGMLLGSGLVAADIGQWAVHPGGKSIVDKVEKGLGLEPEKLVSSRSVLREYGNMSSATILFVLKDLIERHSSSTEHVVAMAFGPGLTIESLLLKIGG